MAKSKINIGSGYKAPFLAAGRILRELAQLTPAGRETAMRLVAEHKFEEVPAVDPRQVELPMGDGVL